MTAPPPPGTGKVMLPGPPDRLQSGQVAPKTLLVTPLAVQSPSDARVPLGQIPPRVVPSSEETLAPKVASQATSALQLPANFQIAPGTVLVRSNTGQLILVSQQALVQAQSQTQSNASVRWTVPTLSSTVKLQNPQNSVSQVLKVLPAPVKTVPRTTHPIKKSVIQSVSSTKSNSTNMMIKGPLANPPAFDFHIQPVAPKPVPDADSTTVAQASTSAEMLENAQKCKNFLATLIKLASSGAQAPEMGQNVKNLVENLLEAKIEPEEFTKKLYIELKSSPQPCLVPFLKKSVRALRQLIPDPQTFIQQCLQQSVPRTAASTCATALSSVSAVANSTPLTFQSARTVLRTSVGISSPQTSVPVPCTSLVTRGSASLQLVQPDHALPLGTLSLQGANSVPPTQLAADITTVKPTSSVAVVKTSNTLLPIIKPMPTPVAVSSAACAALNSGKAVSPSAVATSLQVGKPALTSSALTTSSKAVATTLPVTGKPIAIRVAYPNSVISQPARTSQPVTVKQLIVQQASGNAVKKVSTLQQASALSSVNKASGKMPLNTVIHTNQLPSGCIVKQITLPGNKILSLQASPVQRNKIRANGTTSFRDEDDINDVTSMAGVNLSEESACILTSHSEAVGSVIQSCPEELLLSSDVLQKKIIEIGKKHGITEVNSDVLNLISHATQKRLRGLLEKLTVIAQHRMVTYKENDNYTVSNDTRAQLTFLEQLDQVEKQRKDEEERERLLRAAKSRSNKEDPEQLRLKQKAKEMQQLEFAQMQQREANLAALAAIGPRKKRTLDSSSLASGLEGVNRLSNRVKLPLHPRMTRICLRDLIFCMEQEKGMKRSLALYRGLLK
uniref:TATA-box binding protein associated factor 4b n=1 Tax=Anolis carolinensis TaxID=28377 RepID=G1KA85_ANOCA|nr:PREDICTED: transcription initiation factor TFIID subunit 4B [Anolis carolinensis]|eukprot:XP_008106828.1 PREDICTED: transcription initiation factor TFIID subunit 4B [Anolis carolinensis]